MSYLGNSRKFRSFLQNFTMIKARIFPINPGFYPRRAKHLRMKARIFPINPGANASPLQLKIDTGILVSFN